MVDTGLCSSGESTFQIVVGGCEVLSFKENGDVFVEGLQVGSDSVLASGVRSWFEGLHPDVGVKARARFVDPDEGQPDLLFECGNETVTLVPLSWEDGSFHVHGERCSDPALVYKALREWATLAGIF